MNNYTNVSPKTSKRVKNIMKELGYKPNHMARGLKTNKSYNIVFLIPDITNEFYTEIYKGIYAYALEKGYIVSLYEITGNSSLYESILNLRPDGIILGADMPHEILEKLKNLSIPVARIGGIENENFKMKITIDLHQAMIAAIDYLNNIGHSDIAIITYRNDQDKRYNGYRDGLKKCGLDFNRNKIIYIDKGENHFDQGYFAMQEFFKKQVSITAVIGHNDLVAIGAMKSIIESGLKIPEDISVIGFDDTKTAKYMSPSLTTIKIPKFNQGQKVAELLLNYLSGKKEKTTTMNTELLIRDSTKELGIS